MEPASSKVELSWVFFFFFKQNVMLNIGVMRCVGGDGGVTPPSDNSQRKNRAVCSYLFCCVCVCYYMHYVCSLFLVCVSVYVCVYVHIFVFACVVQSAAEKGTAVAQWYSPCRMTYIQGTPMGVQTYQARVCFFVRLCGRTVRSIVCVCQSVFLCPFRCSAVCWQLSASLEFRRNLFVVLAFSFLSFSISPSACHKSKNRQMPRKCVTSLISLILSYLFPPGWFYRIYKWPQIRQALGKQNNLISPNFTFCINKFCIEDILYLQYASIDFWWTFLLQKQIISQIQIFELTF